MSSTNYTGLKDNTSHDAEAAQLINIGGFEWSEDSSRQMELIEELRSLGEAGVQLTTNQSDLSERFARVVEISNILAAKNLDMPLSAYESVRREWLHLSPIMSADCAAFDSHSRILLIRRADNDLWALPGGLVDVGEGPAAAAAREALEEVGLECEAKRLIGIYDSREVDTDTPFFVIHFVFLCSYRDSELDTSNESTDFGWFGQDELPRISPGHGPRIEDAFLVLEDPLTEPRLR